MAIVSRAQASKLWKSDIILSMGFLVLIYLIVEAVNIIFTSKFGFSHSMHQPFDRIFNDEWMERIKVKVSDNDLYCALRKDKYRKEVNKWLIYFENKGWLNSLEKRLSMATTWSSFYSKMNELRTGYFFEYKLGFQLSEYETQTNKRTNVEFKGIKDNAEFLLK